MSDLLIIGSGGAGLTAALNAAASGIHVTVVTKTLPTQAQTCMAQGGINAALGNVMPDSIKSHIQDTLSAAHGLADAKSVAAMCEQAAEAITWLEELGVPFSRLDHADTPLQSIAQRRLGGASSKRTCYAQDYTGLKLLHTLYDRCIEAGIHFVTEHYLINLIVIATDVGRSVTGATFWDIRHGKMTAIQAQNTLVATGGFSALYHDYTTNSYGSTGDGIVAVLRAGGMVSNMEFVQFHPTALQNTSILISESARGEGGYLIDHKGERFTDELAPRDEVARAIFRQMQAGHHVRLDISHLGHDKIEAIMPQERHLCQLHAGIDPVLEPIPIMPVAHYTMGGIEVEEGFQVKGLSHCYAIGECANAHIHGANRLGGNALLEIITAGITVTRHLVDQVATDPTQATTQIAHDEKAIDKIFAKPNHVNFYHKRKVLGTLMYRDAGIIRQRDSMHEAEIYLDEIYNKLPIMGIGDKTREHNQNLVEFLEFRNAILLAQCTLKSAIARQESRGAHYREDFSLQRNDWERYLYCKLKNGGIVMRNEE